MDFFSILNSFLKTNNEYISNYGDIINESLCEDKLKRGMSQQEMTYFDNIKKNNRERIYEASGNNINTDIKFENPIDNLKISGIGTVSQIM